MKLGELDRKRKLVHQPVRSYLWNRAQGFLRLVFPNRFKARVPRPQPSSVYRPPRLTKLTTEQAKLKLLGHLSVGDQGAKDLLDLLFSEGAADLAAPQNTKPDIRG